MNCSDDILRKHCITLNDLPSDGNEDSDIRELNLFTELKALIHISPKNSTPMHVLCYMCSNTLDEVFPNVTTELHILSTVPIAVASAEQSFSKLRFIKTYLYSTMAEDRLEGLELISIENKIALSLDYIPCILILCQSTTNIMTTSCDFVDLHLQKST